MTLELEAVAADSGHEDGLLSRAHHHIKNSHRNVLLGGGVLVGMMLYIGISLLGSSPSDLLSFDVGSVAVRSLKEQQSLDDATKLRIFKNMDNDFDNEVIESDVQFSLKQMGLPQEEADLPKKMIDLGDNLQKGWINSQDFLDMFNAIHHWKTAVNAGLEMWETSLQTLFWVCDVTGDGKLDGDEVTQFFRFLGVGLSEAQVKKIVAVFDQSQNKVIEWSEWKAMAHAVTAWHEIVTWVAKELSGPEKAHTDEAKNQALKALFAELDLRQHGSLNLNDISKGFKTVSVEVEPEVVKKVLDALDEDGDGEITWEEFQSIFKVIDQWHKTMLKLVKDFHRIGSEDTVHDEFVRVDDDKDGRITEAQAKKLFEDLYLSPDDDDIKELVMMTDKNGDGLIEWSDFQRLYDKTWDDFSWYYDDWSRTYW